MSNNNIPNKCLVLKKICRCCLRDVRDEKPISLFGEKSEKDNIKRDLSELTGVQVCEDDGLSPTICRPCGRTIKSCAKFRSLCLESDRLQRAGAASELIEENEKGNKHPEESISPGISASVAHKGKKIRMDNVSSGKLFNFMKVSSSIPIAPKPPPVPRTNAEPMELITAANKPSGPNPTSVGMSTRDKRLPEFLKPKEMKKSDTDKQNGVEILSSSALQKKKATCTSPTDLLTTAEKEELIESIIQSQPPTVAEALLKNPQMKRCIKAIYLQEISNQCKQLCQRKRGPSVLRVTKDDQKQLHHFEWMAILKEMKERAPDVLDMLCAVAIEEVKDDGSQIPRICTAYGLLMNTRNRELSLVQKVNAVLLGVGHSSKKTFQRLNRCGVTQSRDSLLGVMDSIGGDVITEVRQVVESKSSLRLVFDNLDFTILANIPLKSHRNSDMHWIGQYLTFDRVPSHLLDDSHPLVPDMSKFENTNYLLNEREQNKIKSDFTVLVSRVLVKYIGCLKHLESSVSTHIPHRYSKEMSEKSTVIGLPVVPFNQSKHADVCQYLQYVQDFLSKVFIPDDEPPLPPEASAADMSAQKERILQDVKVPLSGDLLGRERVTGAKKTRMGCDRATERFDNITENATLWHAKQSFLGYTWEQLYKANATSSREPGTLYHLRQQWHMTNVYTSVKKNYQTAENLMLCATKAYLCCAFMEWAGMEDLDGTPTRINVVDEKSSEEEKKSFIDSKIGKFVEEYVLTEFDIEKAWLEQQQQQQQQREFRANRYQPTNSCASTMPILPKLTKDQVVILVQPNEQSSYEVLGVGQVASDTGQNVEVLVAAVEACASDKICVGQLLIWPRKHLAIPNVTTANSLPSQDNNPKLPSPMSDIPPHSRDDRVMNYGLQCLQLGVMLMQLNDTEKEGDGTRSLINWKLLMLYFRSRQRGMKYAFEAMRLITCVNGLYTERMAHRIIHGQFVNTKGGHGQNVANDLRMEMLVKHYKGILKGLCGNKTLAAVERSSGAAYGLSKVAQSFDLQSTVPPDSTSHTHTSKEEDIKEMIKLLHSIKPFQFHPGRAHRSFPTISKSPLDQLDVSLLHAWLTRHKRRLSKDFFANCDDDDDGIDYEDAEDNSCDIGSDTEDGL